MDKRLKFTRQYVEWIDGTPNADYALRILRAYRKNCNVKWSDTKYPELGTIDPVLYIMNEHQEKRARLLDQAIAVLESAGKDNTRFNELRKRVDFLAENCDELSKQELIDRLRDVYLEYAG